MKLEKKDFRSKNSSENVNFGHPHNIINQRNVGSDFRPMGLISVSVGLISGTLGLKPDHLDLKSDLGGLKSGRTEIPILSKQRSSGWSWSEDEDQDPSIVIY